MASFEDREYIDEPDYEIMRKRGLRFRGQNAWPLFRSYLPGYLPWYLNQDEAKFINLALEQAIVVCKRIKRNPDILKSPLRTQIMVRILDGESWCDEWMEPWDLEEEEVMVGYIREYAREDLLKLPHRGVWEADFNLFHEPVQEDADQRPYFPCSIIWADYESGQLLDNTGIVYINKSGVQC